MIPLTFLYGKIIDRPKLTDKENPFENIIPPATRAIKFNSFQQMSINTLSYASMGEQRLLSSIPNH